MKKRLFFIIFLVITFFIIVGIWYSSVLFKGYPAELMGSEMVIARNCADYGVCGIEDDLNIAVAPDLVGERANTSTLGNKFGPISYAVIFKIFGWQNWNNLIFISAFIVALATIIFTLVVYYLFGWRVAVIFPFIYALLPFNWNTVQFLGQYEFALLYFSIFTLLYFWGRDQKLKWVYLVLAGAFLALSGLSKEAMFLFVPILFLWLWLVKRRKEMIPIFLAFGVLLAIFWAPAMLGIGGNNDYIKLFSAKEENISRYTDFHFYGHIYRDPYTFHFDKKSVDERIDRELSDQKESLVYKLNQLKIEKNMGKRSLTMGQNFLVGTSIFFKHLSKYLTLEYIGGPFIFLLMILGFWYLRKKDLSLYYLFLSWLIATPLILSYIVFAQRSHLVDLGWAIATLIALALTGLRPILDDYFNIKGRKLNVIYILIILVSLYGLVVANHVYWGNTYNKTKNLEVIYLADQVNNYDAIAPEEVMAVGYKQLHHTLNYLTGKSTVYFAPNTIKDLIEKEKLQDAFDKFNVTYVIGYESELTDQITKNSNAVSIAIWPDKDEVRISTSQTKGFFLNLVK